MTPRGVDPHFISPCTQSGMDDLVRTQLLELGNRQISHLDFFDKWYGNLYGIMKAMHQAITEVHDVENAFDIILSEDFMPEGSRQHRFAEGRVTDETVLRVASQIVKLQYENATRRFETMFNRLYKRIERLPSPSGEKIVGSLGTYHQQVVSMKFSLIDRDYRDIASSIGGDQQRIIVKYKGLSHMIWIRSHDLLLFKFNGFNMSAYSRLY